jgi:hypothetical protein
LKNAATDVFLGEIKDMREGRAFTPRARSGTACKKATDELKTRKPSLRLRYLRTISDVIHLPRNSRSPRASNDRSNRALPIRAGNWPR